MRLSRSLPAGMIDAGFSSLATFIVGFHAARSLTPEGLGGYSIFFAAFLLVTVVPAQLVLAPAEVQAVRLPAAQRLGLVGRSLLLGLPWAAGSAAAALVAVALVPGEVPAVVVRSLALTTVPAALLSPLQDHVRRMLHIGQRSYHAAATSVVQAVGAGLGIVVLVGADVPTAMVPFGALTIANIASLVTGLAFSRGSASPQHRLQTADLLGPGRWLLFVGLAPMVAGLASATIIARLASAAALGYAEAARIVAQPLLVVAAGLAAVVGPRLMEAGAKDLSAQCRRYRRIFLASLGAAGVLYALAAGTEWAGNPVASLLPNAYVVSWLVLATIAANLVNGMAFPYRYELMGRRRERALAAGETAGAAAQIAAAAAAGVMGAYAKPFGLGLLGLVRQAAFQATLRRGRQPSLKITQRDDD